jgi:hypothetical protein
MVVFREVGFARKKKEVVIAGLDPAIHHLRRILPTRD